MPPCQAEFCTTRSKIRGSPAASEAPCDTGCPTLLMFSSSLSFGPAPWLMTLELTLAIQWRCWIRSNQKRTWSAKPIYLII
jgi:hypothetical protein